MNVTGLAYDAHVNRSFAQAESLDFVPMMISLTAFLTRPIVKKAVEAGLYTSAVKSVGSGFRYYDARNADPELKRNIALGEAATVGQVAAYSMVSDQFVNLASKIANQSTKESLVKTGLQKLTKNRPLTIMLLGCTSNFLAERVSRKFFERDLGPDGDSLAHENKVEKEKDEDDHHEDRADSHDGHQRAESAPVALRFAKSEPLRHQPLTFARSNAASASPFQFANSQFKPAFAKPAFSI